MESDDLNDTGRSSESETPSGRTRGRSENEVYESARRRGATQGERERSWRRSWRAASPLTKVGLIAAAVMAAGTAGSLVAYVIVSAHQSSVAQMEDRPRVIVSRPPELLGTVACYVTDKAIHWSTGAMRIWVRNIGRGDAVSAFLAGPQFKLVPDVKTGVPIIDEIPPINDRTCQLKVSPSSKMFPVYAGQEVFVDMVQSVGVQSLIKTGSVSVALGAPQPEPQTPAGQEPGPIRVAKGAAFQLYAPICVYYSDRSGALYATCRTYRLNVGTPLGGPYSFSCTGAPVKGSFEATIGNFCDN